MAKTRPAADAFKIAGTKSAARAKTAAEPTVETSRGKESKAPARVTAKTQKRQANGADRRAVTVYLPRELFNKLREEASAQDSSLTNVAIEAFERCLK